MTSVVIDTNVLAVAAGLHNEVSAGCVGACARALDAATKHHRVVIDNGWRILREYQSNVGKGKQKNVGTVFLKWLYQNMQTPNRCDQIVVTQSSDKTQFAEFPNHRGLRAQVDPSDCIFIAVAHAHPDKPPIWEAVDSKWLDWEPNLNACGLSVEFLCQADIERFRATKASKAKNK